MAALIEIGAAELCNPDAPSFARKLELNDSIDIARALIVFGRYDQRSTSAGGKSEEGLRKTAVLEGVRSQIAEHTKAVHKDPLWIHVLKRLRYLLADRLTLDLYRREDIVRLHLGEYLRGRREIENTHVRDIHAKRACVTAQVFGTLSERNIKSVFTYRKEMQSKHRLPCSGLTMNKVNTSR